MSDSISKRYLQNKIQNEAGAGAVAGAAASKLVGGATAVNGALGSALPALQAASILGLPAIVFSATEAIRGLIQRSKWDRKGCEAELDPQKKMVCQARARNILLSNLNREKMKCVKAKNPQECQQAFDNKMNMVRQQEVQESYLKTDTELTESLMAMGAIGIGGAALGALAQKGISSYNNRYLTCKLIKDPYNRDKCTMGIIDSMIQNLNDVSERVCDRTPDPAQCKLDLLKKMERLSLKKQKLQRHLSRSERAKILDRTDSDMI